MFLQLNVEEMLHVLSHCNNFVIVGLHFVVLDIANGRGEAHCMAVVHRGHQTCQVHGIGLVVCKDVMFVTFFPDCFS